MTTNILAIGDVHLGNRPASIPSDLRKRIAAAVDPAAVWDRAVDVAIAHEVHSVLLLGDVVHELNDSWRVESILEAGVRKLQDHGIRAISVVGNHDAKALPTLARSINGLELVGEGGQWGHALLSDANGNAIANVIGWSFPRCPFTTSPMVGIQAIQSELADAVPTIGLLHCDLDQVDSDYAPVTQSELDRVSFVNAWLLGHVHTASFDGLAGPRPIGYLGALTPLRARDQREHGPWLVRVSGRSVSMEILPIAPLRFDQVEIDVSTIETVDMIQPRVRSAISDHVRDLGPARESLIALGVDLKFVGSSHLAGEIREQVESQKERMKEYELLEGAITCFIHDVDCDLRTIVDLDALASGSAAGMLATDLRALERGLSDVYCKQIVDEARKEIEKATSHRSFTADERVPQKKYTDEAILEQLVVAGYDAIDELMKTRGGVHVD